MSQLGYGVGDVWAGPFQLVVPLTGASISPTSSLLVLNPAGTISTATILLPSNPVDGQRFRVVSSQIVSTLTITPAPAQTGGVGGTGVGGSLGAANALGTAVPADLIQDTLTALAAYVSGEWAYSLYGTLGAPIVGTQTTANARTWMRLV